MQSTVFIDSGHIFDRDLRARLELGVERVSKLVKEHEQSQPQDSDYTSDSEDVSSMNKHTYITDHRLSIRILEYARCENILYTNCV